MFRASSKGLFRPAARGTGCQTYPSDLAPLPWGFLERVAVA